MAIDGVGWDWSYMENDEENHALVADEEAPIEFALMAKTSTDNEVFDNSLCSKACKKNTDSLNSQITELSEKLGYSVVPPSPAQVYSPPKWDMSWTGLPEFADDIITDYSRPSPSVESNPDDLQNNSSSTSEKIESTSSILSKPEIKFMKPADNSIVVKIDKKETVRKPTVTYAELYRKTSKRKFPTGNSRFSTADIGNKGKAVKPQLLGFGSLHRTYLTKGNSQININDKGYWESGCSRYMTGNISYLSDYEPYDGGYVSFGQGGCKITGKGTIKTGKLEFENVYFVKDLKYNLFSVSQICDNKNSVLFTDLECIVLRQNFKLSDDANMLLRTPRQHNMYSIDLNNVVPHKDLTFLVAKASADECMLWHRILGHLNIKTMNRLVRHNLVRGLPSKCFDNDHSYVACLKGKQHKASCKTKLVNLVSKPLHTLHMNLFGPTSDETSGILRNFITEIENLKELRVKIIKCDNGGEFKNKEMNDFCSRKEACCCIIIEERVNVVRFALTVNPIVYALYVNQLWTTAKVKKVNGQEHIQALADKQKVIIKEESIRHDLKFNDAEDKQVEEMAKYKESYVISSHTKKKKIKPKRKQRQATEVHSPSSEIPIEESIPTPSNDPLPSCHEINKLEKRRKSRPAGLRRLKKVSSSQQVKSSKELDSLGAQEDASKQGRSIEDIDQDAKISLVHEAQGRMHDEDMFGVDDLEVTVASVEDSAALTTATTTDVDDELTLTKTLIAITAAKPKDKGKAKMIEPEKPLKKKDQIALDEEMARKLEAEMKAKIDEEERIAREKNEANRAIIEE
nr:hypothetical protein [Tanacetum cinerariifolium]